MEGVVAAHPHDSIPRLERFKADRARILHAVVLCRLWSFWMKSCLTLNDRLAVQEWRRWPWGRRHRHVRSRRRVATRFQCRHCRLDGPSVSVPVGLDVLPPQHRRLHRMIRLADVRWHVHRHEDRVSRRVCRLVVARLSWHIAQVWSHARIAHPRICLPVRRLRRLAHILVEVRNVLTVCVRHCGFREHRRVHWCSRRTQACRQAGMRVERWDKGASARIV